MPGSSPPAPSPPLHAALLAGGVGSRCWPESRRDTPKQLLSIGTEEPLVVAAWERLDGLVLPQHRWVVTRQGLERRLQALLPDLPPQNLLVEPQPRSTAAAVGLAALAVAARHPGAVLAALPADHVILPAGGFRTILAQAAARAEAPDSPIVLLGIQPTRAATGYGYIQRGVPALQPALFAVRSFHEKPDGKTAWRYFLMGDGEYSWNSGMFVARAERYLSALAAHAPGVAAPLQKLAPLLAGGAPPPAALAAAYADIAPISFDHGVLERLPAGALEVRVVAPHELVWNDVGSWSALVAEGMPVDDSGNSLRGDVLARECSGSVLRSSADHKLVALGVDDLAVIHTRDVTFVAPLDRVDEVQELRRQLESAGEDGLL